MLGLLALKCVVVLSITLASAIGVWAPLQLSLSRHPVNSLVSVSSARGETLSLCNCLSAGMLLANALTHFFPDAFEGDCASKESVSHHAFWLLLGVLFPAMLNRLCPVPHSHSGRASSSPQRPPGTVATLLASNALMLVLLMCFHFATEGMLVGVETTSAALLAIAIPLLIHRFFDGVVVGVSLTKEGNFTQSTKLPCVRTAATEDLVDERRTAPPVHRSMWGALTLLPLTHRVAIALWLLVTPLTFVLTETLQAGAAVPERGHANHTLAMLSSAGSATPEPLARTTGISSVKAFGSGSFIFVALALLSEEELTGARPSLALLVGVCFATALLYISPGEGH